MKINKNLIYALLGMLLVVSCKDDDKPNPGNPVMDVKTQFVPALFGDSIEFNVHVSDAEVPLSTLKAQLFYGEEKVSETIIRTKTDGDYKGKIFIPFFANIPDGTATIKLILQNIHFTLTEKEFDLPLSRPDFPYLTLVTSDGEYRMERLEMYEYKVTDEFPRKLKAHIVAPKVGEIGNEITFGWEDRAIAENAETPIPFSTIFDGTYDVTFNTLTYAAGPFIKIQLNGDEMEMIDDNNFNLVKDLKQGEVIEFVGIPDFEEWWIDPDFFGQSEDGKLKFLPLDGKYSVTVNFKFNYIRVERMDGDTAAKLNDDGSGAIWIIGDNIGKPSVIDNVVGWEPNNALCMSQIEAKKFQITLVAGETVTANSINFKFFHQKGWDPTAFTSSTLTTDSDLVFVGDDSNGRDNGNLGLVTGKTFETGATYVFTIDVTNGNGSAKLSVVKK